MQRDNSQNKILNVAAQPQKLIINVQQQQQQNNYLIEEFNAFSSSSPQAYYQG